MDAFLTDIAVRRLLRTKKDYPPRLEKIIGKFLIIEILNIIEVVTQMSHCLCYCYKFSGCAPHDYYPDQYFACESCQLWSNFCAYSLEQKSSKDVKHLLKIATDIFERRKKIIEKVDGQSADFFNIAYKCTFFVGCFIEDNQTLNDVVDAHELFLY